MDAEAFWDVIGQYNQQTWFIQIIIMVIILVTTILAFLNKAQWLSKVSLGLSNLYMGVVFFLVYGTEPIQLYFAAPLFLLTGMLFIWEGIKNREDVFKGFNTIQWILLALVLVYPFFSLLLGHSFPKIVVYIMPCPLISLSIVIYSGFSTKNKVLLFLMAVWGLTGIKSFLFNALEDTILLVCGLYCLWLLIREFKKQKTV